jgi:hypothetical protein
MSTTDSSRRLAAFRQEVYRRILGHRQDSLFEIMDALLTADGPATLARLSQAPSVRRRWPSFPDALAAGTLDQPALLRLLTTTLPAPAPGERAVWALDGTVWPRPQARTSPERTYGRTPLAGGRPDAVLRPSWEYQWLVALPEAAGSWMLPLDVRRRGPDAPAPTVLAIEQLRAVLAAQPASAPAPVVTFDSGYCPTTLARAQLPGDCLVRLARRRTLFRAPPPRATRGRGRPPAHGPVFRTHDATTHGLPDREATGPDPRLGTITVRVWAGLHARGGQDAPWTLVCVQAERLPRTGTRPGPLWLAWVGGPLPADLLDLWRWYACRFTIEHGFRFSKHDLGWTSVRLRDPAAADRWTWLVALVFWQLWLARALVADRRLPWERPLAATRLTPGRVRRAGAGVFLQVGTPATPPQPRGNAPGRRPGDAPGHQPCFPVVRRHPQRPRRPRRRVA